jgi:small-conductance mechanosensitive channel
LLPAALAHLIAATTPSPSPSPSPTPSPLPTSPTAVVDQLRGALQAAPTCTRDDLDVCGITLRVTGNERLAQVLDTLLGTPLRIVLLIVAGVLIRRLLHRLIDRLVDRLVASGRERDEPPLTHAVAMLAVGPLASTRREQRARTLASVLKSLTTGLIGVVLALMVVGELGYDPTPLLASAGVVGVALGFGCQALVRDFISGIFMIIEDQYGVGDFVDVGEASGTVEAVGLRVTRLRDVDGTVWYVRTGEILRVGNQSQGWSRAVLDVAVAYGEDIDRVQELLRGAADELRADDRFRHRIVEDPEVWGIEQLTPEAVVVRVVVKTQPLQQWSVARELRRRFMVVLERAGITLPAQPWAVGEADEAITAATPAPRSPAPPDGGEPRSGDEQADDVEARPRGSRSDGGTA